MGRENKKQKQGDRMPSLINSIQQHICSIRLYHKCVYPEKHCRMGPSLPMYILRAFPTAHLFY